MLGQVQHGIYRDECSRIHPDNLNRFYGADRDEQASFNDGKVLIC